MLGRGQQRVEPSSVVAAFSIAYTEASCVPFERLHFYCGPTADDGADGAPARVLRLFTTNVVTGWK
jgi:hypothetical protein